MSRKVSAKFSPASLSIRDGQAKGRDQANSAGVEKEEGRESGDSLQSPPRCGDRSPQGHGRYIALAGARCVHSFTVLLFALSFVPLDLVPPKGYAPVIPPVLLSLMTSIPTESRSFSFTTLSASLSRANTEPAKTYSEVLSTRSHTSSKPVGKASS